MSKDNEERSVRLHARRGTMTDVVAGDEPGPGVLISAGANFTLLGGKFMAAFEKKSDGYGILVIPTDTEAAGMSIGEIIRDVNALISGSGASVNQKDVEGKLKDLAEASDPGKAKTFDISKLVIRLRQLFLYYRKTGTSSTTEYAFSLEVDASDCFGTKLGIIGLDTVFFSIWNTERRAILERMRIVDIQGYLDSR